MPAAVLLMAESTPSQSDFTRFEKARVIGARALQIALGAPTLLDTTDFDPVRLSHMEFNEGIIPITVVRQPRVSKFRRPVRVARTGIAADLDLVEEDEPAQDWPEAGEH